MNEFDAMHQILSEWKDVARIKSLNQQLYDQLLGEYSLLSNMLRKMAVLYPIGIV